MSDAGVIRPPTCWVIAGPNGAGKTTYALRYLPPTAGCKRFINADLIAAGLAPLAPQSQQLAASRIFLKEIDTVVRARVDFAFETTLAGRGHLALLRRLKSEGWRIKLVYLALPDVQVSTQRVAERVAHGGHDIPEADILRRFPRSLANLLGPYSDVADLTVCFMNMNQRTELVFDQQGGKRTIHNAAHYHLIEQEARR
jgi:predicted ABC-type ATPase